MRDEIDSRVWIAQHDQFSKDLDQVISRIGSALKRLANTSPGLPSQLAALIGAFAITAITIGGTAA